MRRRISTGSPFEEAFGYSRSLAHGPWIFVSGTTGYDYSSMTMPEDPIAQARNAWATITRVLEECGSSLNDIVRCHYYVTERAFAEPVLTVCGTVLRDVRPAATLTVTGLLKPEMKVEIEVTALRA
jgi:enamine deaminase RidA (YjgF/YER057c/UK114 family)